MGIHGLWDVIESTSRPINIEDLKGQIISIDVSIWMHQSGKGMKDMQGNKIINAHLVSIFKRISKIIFYGIKPIVVFDGNVPQLKLQTMSIRREKINQSLIAQKVISKNRIEKLMLNHIVNQDESNKDFIKKIDSIVNENSSVHEEIYRQNIFNNPFIDPGEEKNDETHSYMNDCDDIVWTSVDFNFLPDEIKLELLLEERESSKICPKDQLLHHLDDKNNDSFSSFQMKRLIHSSSILRELEKVRSNVRNEANSIFKDYPKVNLHEKNETIFSHILSAHDRSYALIKGYTDKKNINLDLLKYDEFHLINKKENKTDPEFRIKDKFFNKIKSKCKNNSPPIYEDNKANELNLVLSDDDNDDYDNEEIKDNLNDDYTQNVDTHEIEIIGDTNLDNIDFNKIKNNANVYSHLECSSFNENIKNYENIKKKTDIDIDLNNKIESTNITYNSDKFKHSDDDLTVKHLNTNDLDDNLICFNSKVYNPQSANEKLDLPLHNYSICTKIMEENNSSGDESDSNFVEVDTNENKEYVEDVEDETTILLNIKEVPYETDRELVKANTVDEANKQQRLIDSNFNANTLNADLIELEMLQNRENRNTWTINDQIIEEVKELLQLFGVPYITSPTEAEAQCAFLEYSGQCNGTITEDSDIWAFGGCTVYKNFFNSKKNCCIYRLKDIIGQLGLDRNRIIGLAILCGCDYTIGITGIGPITALEILAYFDSSNLMNNLTKFREYWQNLENCKEFMCSDHIKNILRKISIPKDFPNRAVYEAFMDPSVDRSNVQFKWNRPNLDGLRRFAAKNLGWNEKKVDEIILPVLKKYNLHNNVNNGNKLITDFYSNNSTCNPKQSKRLKLAVKKLKNNTSNNSNIPGKNKFRRKNNAKNSGGFISLSSSSPVLSEDSSDEISDEILAHIPL